MSGFDHHCRYLNNCIGEQNYDYFFKLIIWVFWLCLMHNVTNAFVIYDIAKAEEVDESIATIQAFYGADVMSQLKIMLYVMCSLNLLAILFLVNLIVFHIELKYRGLTTYEFLKMQENKSMKSKIVIEITAELRAEMEQEQRDRLKLAAEQAELRKQIELAAL